MRQQCHLAAGHVSATRAEDTFVIFSVFMTLRELGAVPVSFSLQIKTLDLPHRMARRVVKKNK